MADRRPLIHADGQRSHARDPVRHLHAEQHAAGAGFRALAHHDLDAVRHPEVLEVQHVARRRHLVDQRRRRGPLVLEHPSLAGARHRARLRGAVAECGLRARGERPERHRSDVDRNRESDRLRDQPGTIAQHRLRPAALAVSLERQAGHGCRHEHEVVEAGHPVVERVVAAELVATELGHGVDVRNRLRGPPRRSAGVIGSRHARRTLRYGAVAQGNGILGRQVERVPVFLRQIISHADASLLSKCQRRRAETILRHSRDESPSPRSASSASTALTSSGSGSSIRVSIPSERGRCCKPHLASPEGVRTSVVGAAERDEASRVRHEPREVSDAPLDEDVAALHRDAAARTGVAPDMQQSAPHRGARRHPRVASDHDLAAGHRLADRPPGVALNLDPRAVVESAAVVADAPVDAHARFRGQADGEVVAGSGITHDDVPAFPDRGANVRVHVPDRPLAGVDRLRPHAGTPSPAPSAAPVRSHVLAMPGPS